MPIWLFLDMWSATIFPECSIGNNNLTPLKKSKAWTCYLCVAWIGFDAEISPKGLLWSAVVAGFVIIARCVWRGTYWFFNVEEEEEILYLFWFVFFFWGGFALWWRRLDFLRWTAYGSRPAMKDTWSIGKFDGLESKRHIEVLVSIGGCICTYYQFFLSLLLGIHKLQSWCPYSTYIPRTNSHIILPLPPHNSSTPQSTIRNPHLIHT